MLYVWTFPFWNCTWRGDCCVRRGFWGEDLSSGVLRDPVRVGRTATAMATVGHPDLRMSGAEEFVGGDGVFADADAGGVVDGVGDGGGDAGDADLADAAGAEWIEFCVGDVEHGDVEGADVGVHRNMIVSEVFIDGAAGDGVDEGLFGEGEADAPDDA